MTISRRLRFEILKRDGHTCRYCGAKAPDVKLTVDHVVPIALGGGDEPNNLVAACADCNAGKSSTNPSDPLVADVDATALLFAHAIEVASQRRREEALLMAAAVDVWGDYWLSWGWTDSAGERHTMPLPSDWRASIERFYGYGLSMAELEAFVDTAMGHKGARDEFRLFCSLAWKEIGERQELARRLIEDGEV